MCRNVYTTYSQELLAPHIRGGGSNISVSVLVSDRQSDRTFYHCINPLHQYYNATGTKLPHSSRVLYSTRQDNWANAISSHINKHTHGGRASNFGPAP